jgi:predicted phosphodiesterase
MAVTAIVSDIHANLVALEAVLADINKLGGVGRIVCLGDVIGYGPEPVECLRIAKERFEFTLLGNHEFAILHGAEGFNPVAEAAVEWTRSQVKPHKDLMDMMGKLKAAKLEENVLYVHGSVKDPLMDYVREVDSHASFNRLLKTIEQEFKFFDICFTGHNHRAFLGTNEAIIYPHPGWNRFHVSHAKLYVCVGSVGQPRDDDPRASYVTFDGESVEYHRVKYDIARTAERIRKVGLHEFLADRLFVGQ